MAASGSRRRSALGHFYPIPFIRHSWLFVDYFFVLSGFVISYGYFGDDTGMEDIRIFLDSHKPAYHFFGHIGEAYYPPRLDENGVTLTCKLADLTWARDGSLAPDSFGLLRWHSPSDHHFEVINAPWLSRINRYTWKYR